MTEFGSRLYRSMDVVDSMPGDLRQCVHEFGLPIVEACLEAGVKSPNNIRQLVYVIWEGPRNYLQRRATAGQTVDWLLMNSVGEVSAAGLVELLRKSNLVIVPISPTKPMIEASLKTLNDHSVRCTKYEKHKLRLQAALAAEPNYLTRASRRATP